MPGVTVEAASPALIEKIRTVVTDGSGQYQIIDLRPGVYTVTFTLAGFNTVRRTEISLAGSGTVSVSAEMRVGALEETITVTGEAPLVDVQSVTQQRVLDKAVVDAIPTGRYVLNLGVLVPGVTIGTGPGQQVSNDVGGTLGETMATIAIHGGRGADNRLTIDGLSIADAMGAGGTSGIVPNMTATQEVTIDTSAVGADQAGGGVRINVIPREGGNTFRGTVFFNGTTDTLQGSNYTEELKRLGMAAPNGVKSIYDFNPGVGGPLLRDKVWFFTAGRLNGNENWVSGMFHDRNRGNPNVWTWDPDPSKQATSYNDYTSVLVRLTVQASAKDKFSIMHDHQSRKSQRVSATSAPEAQPELRFPIEALTSATWSSPRTNRILLEAGVQQVKQIWYNALASVASGLSNQIGVNAQATGTNYRGVLGAGTRQPQAQRVARASISYVTGSHAVKVGVTDRWGWNRSEPSDNPYALSYRVNNYTQATPNQLTQRAVANTSATAKMIADYAIYAQDRWTMNRLTLNYALRYEGLVTHTAPGFAGPTLYAPTRNITFEEKPWGNMKDVTPRLGLAYDLFGDGKTAIKTTLNKYISAATYSGFNPISALSTSVTRQWIDSNGNYRPDCDLINQLQNGECGQSSNLNFGNQTPVTAIDPDTYTGWGKREYNWEFSTSVQHELFPRTSVNVGYFRRWYGNFQVTDNRAIGPSDHSPYSITAPLDPRLPDGGGYTVTGLYDLNPNKVGQVDNYTTFASNFGKRIEHWNGVDASADVRLGQGVLLQGGVSTGRTTTDNCEVVAKVDNPSPLFCRQVTNFLTQVKALGAYTIPSIDLMVSATFQSLPGPQILANYVAGNAQIAPTLGRNLSSGTTATINVVEPGTMYGDRLNQLDLRFGRTFQFGGTRTLLALDVYNALNVNPVVALSNAFANWQTPQAILDARFAKVTLQFDF